MGVPTSEVGYTAAMPRREDHEVHKDMWWGHWGKKTNKQTNIIKTRSITNIIKTSFYYQHIQNNVLSPT
jgi:hypothetical protein